VAARLANDTCGKTMKRAGFIQELTRKRTLYLMLLPAVAFFTVFHYVPLAGLILAFKQYDFRKGMFLSPWNGLENFRFFFLSGRALGVTLNTILYNLAFLGVGVVLEVSVAVLISEIPSRLFKKITQSLLFLHYFISWVIVGAFAYNILNYEYGALNGLLRSLNLEPFNAYGEPWVWKYVLLAVNAWKWTGYGSIIYLAAIMAIDPTVFESARIDGAGVLQQIRHITLPMLKPTIVVLLLLSLGTVLRGDFQMFYQIIGDSGNLFNATDVIDTFVFRALFRSSGFNVGMASAAGFYQSVFCFAIIMITNAMIRRLNSDYALY
jgi:putative aldouronate transport system permease protein